VLVLSLTALYFVTLAAVLVFNRGAHVGDDLEPAE